MTDTTQIDALIAAVEAGDDPNLVLSCLSDAGIILSNRTTALKAFNGSLDAALALHEALLPGWGYAVSPQYAKVIDQVRSGDKNLSKEGFLRGKAMQGASNPARAWLLAILKAYRAQASA